MNSGGVQQDALNAFVANLDKLRDWPDRDTIMAMTSISEKNINFAYHFANILVTRLTSDHTHASYKLPIFYVIDALMKHVGGPFAALFGKHFEESYFLALRDLLAKDRKKVDFLLGTWTERGLFPPDLIIRMRNCVSNPSPAVTTHMNVSRMVPSVDGYVAGGGGSGGGAPSPGVVSIGGVGVGTPSSSSSIYSDLIKNEMVTILNQMYKEMNVTNPLSLHELASANPTLYAQLQGKAEENARTIMSRRVQQQQPRPYPATGVSSSSSLARGFHAPVDSAIDSMLPQFTPHQLPPAVVVGQKRTLDDGIPAAAAGSGGGNQSLYQNAQQRASVTVGSGTPGGGGGGGGARYRSRFSQSTRTGMGPAMSAAAAAAEPLRSVQQQQARGDGEGAGHGGLEPMDISATTPEKEEVELKYSNDHFIRGFVGEVQVVVDMDRVKSLRDVLCSGYTTPSQETTDSSAVTTIAPTTAAVVAAVVAAEEEDEETRAEVAREEIENDTGAPIGGERTKIKVKEEGEEPAKKEEEKELKEDSVVTAENALKISAASEDGSRSIEIDAATAAAPAPAENVPSEGFHIAAKRVVRRLSAYIDDVNVAPRLPPILFAPLPLEPIFTPAFTVATMKQQQASESESTAPRDRAPQLKIPTPEFRPEELGRNPDRMIGSLYTDRPHQFHEDGIRYSSLAELQRHTNEFLERKKLLQKTADRHKRAHREWYCTASQWATDFNTATSATLIASDTSGSIASVNAAGATATGSSALFSSSSAAAAADTANVQYVVPADEHFTRCPISKEVFEVVWDAEEGEMMYRNAVKVLVTPNADAQLYEQAQPLEDLFDVGGGEAEASSNQGPASSMRYLIVHKLLVLDQWLMSGKAATVRDAILRYTGVEGMYTSTSPGEEKIKQLLHAVADEDEQDDTFVILDFNS